MYGLKKDELFPMIILPKFGEYYNEYLHECLMGNNSNYESINNTATKILDFNDKIVQKVFENYSKAKLQLNDNMVSILNKLLYSCNQNRRELHIHYMDYPYIEAFIYDALNIALISGFYLTDNQKIEYENELGRILGIIKEEKNDKVLTKIKE